MIHMPNTTYDSSLLNLPADWRSTYTMVTHGLIRADDVIRDPFKEAVYIAESKGLAGMPVHSPDLDGSDFLVFRAPKSRRTRHSNA